MNRISVRQPVRIAAVSFLLVGLGVVLLLESRQGDGRGPAQQPEGAHWCIRRCCELLGAPVQLPAIVEMLPPQERGHSMLQMAELLRKIGFDVDGRMETLESLSVAQVPIVAHLADPDHFVVVVGVKKGRVHLFDGAGRRTSRPARVFRQQWTGHVLYVRRPGGDAPLPAFAEVPSQPFPRVQFQTLFVDVGELRPSSEPVAFAYPFRNLGRGDLQIKEVHKTCPCVEANAPSDPVPPGGTGEIKLSYHLPMKLGPFFQEVLVETNDALFPLIQLKAAGFINTGVSADPKSIDFGDITVGRGGTARCFIKYSGDWEEFSVGDVTCDMNGVTLKHVASGDQEFAQRLWPRAGGDFQAAPGIHLVELSLQPDAAPVGALEGAVVVETNIKGFERVTVPVTGRVVPPVSVYPSLVSFGEVSQDEMLERTVTVVSRLDRAFNVLGAKPASLDVRCAASGAPTSCDMEVHLSSTGAAAAALSGDDIMIRVQMADTGEEFLVPLRVFALDRERHHAGSSDRDGPGSAAASG